MPLEMFSGFVPVIDGKSLKHVKDVRPNQNMQEMEVRCDGSLDVIDLLESHSNPEVMLETFALKEVFGSGAGQLGLSIHTGLNATTGNTILQYQKAQDGGGFAGGAQHFTLTSPRSFVFLESLIAEQDAQTPATAKLKALLLSASGVTPQLTAATATLTGAPALADWYALGPLYINSVAVDGLTKVEFVTGMEATPRRADGERIAGQCRIVKRRPELRLQLMNLSVLAAQKLGLSSAAGVVDQYFRHIDAAGGRTADTGTGNDKHLRLSFPAARVLMQEVATGDEVSTTPTLVCLGTPTLTVGTFIPYA